MNCCILKLSVPFLFLFSAAIQAQTIYTLDLESSIELARQKSRTMLILKERLEGASYNLKAATSQLRTHVDFSATMPQYTETIRQWEDSSGISFFPVRQNLITGNVIITQPLPTDGNLFIRSGIQNLVDYYDDDRNAQVTSSIGLRQPIEAFFGYNNLKIALNQAKLAYDLSLKQLTREELNLVYNISLDFFSLISYQERMNIARLSLNKQSEAYEIARSKFAAGLIREVESLQMEVDLSAAANNLDIATVDYFAQVRLFKENLGIDLKDSIIVKNALDYTAVNVDVEQAVALALANRLELKENEIQIELQEMEIKRRRAEGMINGAIQVNYNFIGVNKSDLAIPLRTSLNDTWQNLMDRPGSFGVGLTVNIPIIDWGENRARVNSARATLRQNQYQMDAQKVSIERDTRTTVERLQSSLRRLQLLEKNVVVAEKSFEISRQRYANGDIDSQAMALERERLNSAYISRLESYINYKLLLSDLMRKTFFDFEKNRSMSGEVIK
jgi:outer membrane protein TolC